MIFERQVTKDSTITRIRVFALPLQIGLLLISTLFVVHIAPLPNNSFATINNNNNNNHHRHQLEERLSPRKLRQTTIAISSHVDYQRKTAVIDDIRKMYEGTKLDRDHIHDTLKKGKELLSQIDTIYNIQMPKIDLEENAEASKKGITIVGDIHGQLPNMIHLFKVNGFPSLERPYIFNGDMTDKGPQGLECLLSLLLIKLYCNECVYLHVGNHETQSHYPRRFKQEVIEKYDQETYKLAQEVMLQLPLGAVIDNRIFVVHAGIPYKDFVLDDLRHYKRGVDYNRTTAEGSMFRRSVWADPTDGNGDDDDGNEDESVSNKKAVEEDKGDDDVQDFKLDEENDDDRGWYTADHTRAFLKKHHLEYIVRGHEPYINGFQHHHDGRVITIHSYPSRAQDQGAYLNIYSSDKSMNIEQFSGVQFSSISHESKMDWRSL